MELIIVQVMIIIVTILACYGWVEVLVNDLPIIVPLFLNVVQVLLFFILKSML